jgi:hypothetical protein
VEGERNKQPPRDATRADVERARDVAAETSAARERVAAQARLGSATETLRRAVVRLRRVMTTPRPR